MTDSLKTEWSEFADALGQVGFDILVTSPVTTTDKISHA
jgi:hypothetical protein